MFKLKSSNEIIRISHIFEGLSHPKRVFLFFFLLDLYEKGEREILVSDLWRLTLELPDNYRIFKVKGMMSYVPHLEYLEYTGLIGLVEHPQRKIILKKELKIFYENWIMVL